MWKELLTIGAITLVTACGGDSPKTSENVAVPPPIDLTASVANEQIIGAGLNCEGDKKSLHEGVFLYPGQTANVKGLRITALTGGDITIPENARLDTIKRIGTTTTVVQTQSQYKVRVDVEYVTPTNSGPGVNVVANFECIEKGIGPVTR